MKSESRQISLPRQNFQFLRIPPLQLGMVLVFAALAVLLWTVIASTGTLRPQRDLFFTWIGAREFFLHGNSPYSQATFEALRTGLTGPDGGLLDPGAGFAYPLHIVFVMAPFAMLPYTLAEPVWLVTNLILLYAAIRLLAEVRLADAPAQKAEPAQRAAFPALVLWAACLGLFQPAFETFILGQYTILALLGAALALYAALNRRDWLCGLALLLCTVRPQNTLFFVILILLWAGLQRRWNVWLSFGGFGLVILAVSWVMAPGWLLDWWSKTGEYTRVMHPQVPLAIAGLDGTPALAVGLLLTLPLVWLLHKAKNLPRMLLLAGGVALALTYLTTPQISGYGSLPLLVGCIAVLGQCPPAWAGVFLLSWVALICKMAGAGPVYLLILSAPLLVVLLWQMWRCLQGTRYVEGVR